MKKTLTFFILLCFVCGIASTMTRDDAINYYNQIKEKYDYIDFFAINNKYNAIALTDKNVKDEDLKYLSFFPELEAVHLSQSNITDEGLKYLRDLPKLRILNLDKTKITDKGLIYLKDLKSLTDLDLFYTKVTDEGIQVLASVKTLRMLLLHGTKVTQKGIDELQKKLPKCYITLETREEIGFNQLNHY